MERLKLEEIGLKHIKTFKELEAFCKGFYSFLLSKNIYSKKNEQARYNTFRRHLKSYIVCFLRNFSCEHCGTTNKKRALHFHHINPDTKINKVSTCIQNGLIHGVKESLKCLYLCDECHYKEHLRLGDYYGYYEVIDRWRYTYIQNLLGSTE